MLPIVAQYDGTGEAAGCLGGCACGGLFFLVWLALIVGIIAGFWKTFVKAGKPGWAAIVPIYNIIILLEIAGKPIWWIVLFLLPLVNIVAAVLVGIEVAKRFGKDQIFGVGLGLLPFIFYPILGFSSAQYQGPPPSSTV